MSPYEHAIRRDTGGTISGAFSDDVDPSARGVDRAMAINTAKYAHGCPDIGADEIYDPKQVQQFGWAAHELLADAAAIVEGDRAAQHGPKERNHQNIADHWNAYLGTRLGPAQEITALDVALMMVLLKVARTKAGDGRDNRDNYVDMAGYAGVAGEIARNWHG